MPRLRGSAEDQYEAAARAERTDIRNFQRFSESVRNFKSWLADAAPGAMDLDCLIERNGNFLVLEGKPWLHGVEVTYGQHKALKALAQQPKTRVYLVGEDEDERLHLMRYDLGKHQYRPFKNVVWFRPDNFIPSDRDGLTSMVRAWWKDASG